MADPKFTPGPWRFDSESVTIQCQSKWTDDAGEHFDFTYPRILARVTDDWDQAANGRLAASAPDQYLKLEAFVGIVRSDELLRSDVELAAAADEADELLVKVRGES